MPRYIAFLRAINVGGHTVKMDYLKEIFESLAFASVETFIASGNVVFGTKSKDTAALERRIEQKLLAALGYEVATFIRTEAELASVATHEAFPPAVVEAASALTVGFLATPVDEERKARLMALRTDIDDLHLHGREVYWLCQKRQSETKLSNGSFEKALGVKATFRGINTVRRMAERYARVS